MRTSKVVNSGQYSKRYRVSGLSLQILDAELDGAVSGKCAMMQTGENQPYE